MAQAQSFYERHSALTWWFVILQIGQGLRQRFEAPPDLPPKLLALLVQLDAIEGNFLLRYAPPLERRSIEESDWLPPRFVWQKDANLFGG
jgi:hypothetical protein